MDKYIVKSHVYWHKYTCYITPCLLSLCVSPLFQNPPNITNFMTQDILFYNITYMSTTGSSSPEVKVSAGGEVCSANGICNHTIRDERLTEQRYNVKVAASNIIGTGQSVTCQGHIGKYVQHVQLQHQHKALMY